MYPDVEPPPPPPPPPPVGVDCSPGYYKNHWDVVEMAECDIVPRVYLMAEMGASEPEREYAKAILDACFERAGYSPCDDD